jgi:hypothetical protein
MAEIVPAGACLRDPAKTLPRAGPRRGEGMKGRYGSLAERV